MLCHKCVRLRVVCRYAVGGEGRQLFCVLNAGRLGQLSVLRPLTSCARWSISLATDAVKLGATSVAAGDIVQWTVSSGRGAVPCWLKDVVWAIENGYKNQLEMHIRELKFATFSLATWKISTSSHLSSRKDNQAHGCKSFGW